MQRLKVWMEREEVKTSGMGYRLPLHGAGIPSKLDSLNLT